MTSGIPNSSTYTTPRAGDHVRHPLYPELGTGLVLTASPDDLSPGVRAGTIRWQTGQESHHNLGVLKIVNEAPQKDTQ